MSNTPRTLSGINTLLADNIVGAISPQDIRDAFLSVFPARVNVDNYNFAAMFPGGSLSVGSNTVTFTSSMTCPAGLAVGSLLYISSGVGTPEVVTVTAITATAGASSGTMSFTCSFTHSAGWAILSATAGMLEAATVNPGKLLELSSGNYTIYTGFTLPSTCHGVVGQGRGRTFIVVHYTAGSALIASSSENYIFRDFTIYGSEGDMTSGAMIDVTAASNVIIESIAVGSGTAAYKAFRIGAGPTNVWINDCRISANFYGIELNLVFFSIHNVQILNAKDNTDYLANSCGIYLKECAGSYGTDIIMDAGMFAYGWYVDCPTTKASNEVTLKGLYIDRGFLSSFNVVTAGTGTAAHWVIDGFRFLDPAAAFGASPVANVVSLPTNAVGWHFANGSVSYGNRGFQIDGGADISLVNVTMSPNYSGGAATGAFIISATGTPKNISIVGCKLGIVFEHASGTTTYAFYNEEPSLAGLVLVGNYLFAATQAGKIRLQGDEVNPKIANNYGISNFRKTMASANTLALPVMDDQDSIEITGSTAINTDITGVREGQVITAVFTDAAPPAISTAGVVQVGAGFTPTRYVPTIITKMNGVVYVG